MFKQAIRLGEMLVQKGLITQSQLEDVLREQRLTKEFLGVILLKKGLVEREKFLAVLSEQFNIPYIAIDENKIDITSAAGFPASIVVERRCVPIGQDDIYVTIAITNPLDAWALSQAEAAALPLRPKWVLVREEDMDKLIVLYRQKMRENMRRLFSEGKE